jgi:hypothetical protein
MDADWSEVLHNWKKGERAITSIDEVIAHAQENIRLSELLRRRVQQVLVETGQALIAFRPPGGRPPTETLSRLNAAPERLGGIERPQLLNQLL